MKWAIEMTAILGGENLCGPYHSPLGVFSGEGPTADEKKRAADVLREAAEEAQKAKVMLAIEYLNRFECYFLTTAADCKAFVKQVNHPHFRMMYDTFHANIEEKHAGPGHRARSSTASAHVHISENDRGTPGTGHVAWDETFRGAAQGGLRRLDGDRIVRPGAAGPGGGDEGVARPVPVGGRGLHARDQVHQGEMGGHGEVSGLGGALRGHPSNKLRLIFASISVRRPREAIGRRSKKG